MRIVVLLASLVGQVKGVFRASPVVSLAVSVSAVGFVVGGVLLSSYRAVAKGELLCLPRQVGCGDGGGPGGFYFCVFRFGVMSSAGVDR